MFGLFSSFHCIGMCGPIAFALPLNRTSKLTIAKGVFTYNAFRILTYAMLGGLFGAIGRTFYTAGLQRGLSIGVGSVLILAVIFPVFVQQLRLESQTVKVLSRTKAYFIPLFKSKQWYALGVLGVFNGLLPCGLVYWALVGAVVSGTFLTGSVYLIAFGLGTIPMMVFASYAGNWLSNKTKKRLRSLIPVFLFLMGAMLVVRGLNLNIPYLSPFIDLVVPGVTYCN